ncbi:MAG: monofunctional biosynthetic peptidoglycan transglycosylase [Prevotella sp.]|nr:monofunctional biosynthetic peptidoglycan transglycosylase [Prevotella sp.]
MWKKIRNFIRIVIVTFFVSTILAVVAYKFLPVYVTPLMIIRCVEQIADGHSPRVEHKWVSLEEMSASMPVAVMGSEDARFLLHHGFDFKQIEHAARQNAAGGKKVGASTITQQTAKNVFLWPGRTWVRKGFEAYFTALIELLWSKQRIMEVYLNSIETGDGIYGVEAVARLHFGKSAKELTRAECALIAATLPNPRKYSSLKPSKYIIGRQHKIETNMKYIPKFPAENEDIDKSTVKGGIYKK